VIEDLDGGDSGPSRASTVRAISVVLVVAAVIGWAALQSPALRGPYATPDPRAGLTLGASVPRAPEPAAMQVRIPVTSGISPLACLQIQQTRTGYGFVGDHPVTLTRVFPTPPPGVETRTVVTVSGTTLMWLTCQPELSTPAWRFAP
jgi:hypothetical protein